MNELRRILLVQLARCGLLCIASGWSCHVLAQEEVFRCPTAASDDDLALQHLDCMSDEELQTLRGGFMLDDRIVIGFGFERIVRIDGEIQEHVLAGLPALNLTNNIQLVPINRSIEAEGQRLILQGMAIGDLASARDISTGGSMSGLTPQIQLIPSTAALQELMSNVIQNSVDGKTIEQLRVINIDLMGLVEAPRFDPQRDLNPALIESLGL
jgi:hypothetical protein